VIALNFLFIRTEKEIEGGGGVGCLTLKKWAGIILTDYTGLSSTRNFMALVDLVFYSVVLFLL